MDNRETYYEIRSNFLECYYEYCRHKTSKNKKWVDGEHEIGYAYDQFVDSSTGRHTCFHTPIEKLMLEVIACILDGGRNEQAGKYHREAIAGIIERGGEKLIKVINNLPEEERFYLVSDLKLLKIDFSGVTDKKK